MNWPFRRSPTTRELIAAAIAPVVLANAQFDEKLTDDEIARRVADSVVRVTDAIVEALERKR